MDADDHIGLCVPSDLGSPNDEVQITIRYLRMSSDFPSLDDKSADDDVSLCVSMGSLGSS